ncbi:MAG: trypsin-like peptidase domain-containing protein [Gammaproteobacteria bacterium]|nr:trypsin-like peptidase domain-containing protein [Gammaproteobacteria bacterium]
MAEPGTSVRPTSRWRARLIACATPALIGWTGLTPAASLPDVIDEIRPSVVGIATFEQTRRPPVLLRGTGFAVADGTLVVTNAHVVQAEMNTARNEYLAALVGHGERAEVRRAQVVATDEAHDLALLRIGGTPLQPVRIGDPKIVREGMAIAFTGFPIGAVLGLYPVTNTGIVSAITPIKIPAFSTRELSANDIRLLRDPYMVIQLDATAYPGNSGSPVYDAASGEIIAVINKVFVKGKKENALKDPSDITYSIPASYIVPLLEKARGP